MKVTFLSKEQKEIYIGECTHVCILRETPVEEFDSLSSKGWKLDLITGKWTAPEEKKP